MNLLKIVIADDHSLVREGVRQLLNLEADIRVVAEASDGAEAVELVREHRPDILILDMAMPRMSGLDTLKLVKAAAPETEVIILTMYQKEAYVQDVLTSGALGYVLKTEPSRTLLEAVRAVSRKEYFLSPKMRSQILGSYLKGSTPPRRSRRYESLSEREKQIFRLLAEGNTNQQISDLLCLSPKTVEKHRSNIARKINISHPVEMMKYAVRIGVIDPETWCS